MRQNQPNARDGVPGGTKAERVANGVRKGHKALEDLAAQKTESDERLARKLGIKNCTQALDKAKALELQPARQPQNSTPKPYFSSFTSIPYRSYPLVHGTRDTACYDRPRKVQGNGKRTQSKT